MSGKEPGQAIGATVDMVADGFEELGRQANTALLHVVVSGFVDVAVRFWANTELHEPPLLRARSSLRFCSQYSGVTAMGSPESSPRSSLASSSSWAARRWSSRMSSRTYSLAEPKRPLERSATKVRRPSGSERLASGCQHLLFDERLRSRSDSPTCLL
jgi:hypothetical protein